MSSVDLKGGGLPYGSLFCLEENDVLSAHPMNRIYSVENSPYLFVHDLKPVRSSWYNEWQRKKPEWLSEMAGEFFGVFCYVYAGVGAQAALLLASATSQPALGSHFTVGVAYAAGIAFAITTGGSSSGYPSFNPAFSVAFAIWKDMPWRKLPRYLFAQILGAFVAGLVVYAQYRPYLLEIEAGMIKAGHGAAVFSGKGPAGVFAFYPNADIPLRWVFVNEFFSDFFIAIVFWGIIDYSNIFTSPTTVPLLVGLAFGVAIWCFAPGTVALNPARDLGCRLVAISIWGTKAWGGKYAAISALTSFPATILGASVYQLLLTDSTRVVTAGAREIVTNKRERRLYRAEFLTRRLRQRHAYGGSSQSVVSQNETA